MKCSMDIPKLEVDCKALPDRDYKKNPLTLLEKQQQYFMFVYSNWLNSHRNKLN